MKPVVYTGTSISHSEARKILDADYRPPIRRHDIRRLLKSPPEIIGIIDGVFFDNAAVAHREIIEAIKTGSQLWAARVWERFALLNLIHTA